VVASEIVLVFALAAHLTGGLRLLFIELVAWESATQKTLIAVAGGIAALCAIAFAVNVI
jgi:fumarate reductase subunit D